MINTLQDAQIKYASVHYIGDAQSNVLILSEDSLILSEDLKATLGSYFLPAFSGEEQYSFCHPVDIHLNELFVLVRELFSSKGNNLHDISKSIAQFLHSITSHPQIKAGELYVVYFSGCIYDNHPVDAVGVFKSENKEPFLHINKDKNSIAVTSMEGVSIKKLDKGALIINVNEEDGYRVHIVDNTNKGGDAQYWLKDFLQVEPVADNYHFTKSIITGVNDFIRNNLPEHFDILKSEQAELLSSSTSFFKENDMFSMDDFEKRVLRQDEIIRCFRNYVEDTDNIDLPSSGEFTLSHQAVQKQTRRMKSVIKLDKNFHIYVHGGEGMIKKGYDEASGMEFYQLFFKKEE